MFYAVDFDPNDKNKLVKAELADNNIFTQCPECKEVFQIDFAQFARDYFCNENMVIEGADGSPADVDRSGQTIFGLEVYCPACQRKANGDDCVATYKIVGDNDNYIS